MNYKQPKHFICCEVLKSPIHLSYPQGTKENGHHVKYENVRFYFHTFINKNKKNHFILASQYFPFRNHGVKSGTYKDLYSFLSYWKGESLDEDAFKELSFRELRDALIDLTAVIDYTVRDKGGKKLAIINSIKPGTGYVRPYRGIIIPDYLKPGYQREAPKMGLLGSGGKPTGSMEGLTAEKEMYGEANAI